MEPTNNDPEFRTWDPHGQSSTPDQHKYNPWRAPGMAPVVDPCGIASGGTNPGTYAAVPGGFEGGAKGSEVLPETEATLWQAGATASVGWALSAQHSGGYSYRLCPKDSALTEACFQSNTLTFAGNSSIHWNDDSQVDKKIVTRTYVAPDGTQWRTNPIPACLGKEQWPVHGSATPDCTAGTMFEPGFTEFTQGFLRPGNSGKNKVSVMDDVNVPNKPGKYVLGWRWDCEEADQVWQSCADIEIVDHSVPVPEQPSHDPDGTCPDFVPGVDDCSSKGCMSRDASGNCLECCSGCWWMYNGNGNVCSGGTKPGPAPTPTPSPSPSPSDTCASRTPEKSYDCYYYEGCKTGTSTNCTECCDGCHLESDPTKGTYCMEDKMFTV